MKRTILLATAAAALVGLANPANAALYLFTLTGAYNASWILDSDPVPASSLSYTFKLTNVTGDFPGLIGDSVIIDFYNHPELGAGDGFVISDPLASPGTVLADASGAVLFDGEPDVHPTFKLGTFDLLNNHGSTPYHLVIAEAPGAVPEPAAWAMMIAGLGLVGAAMRRAKVSVRYATA